MMEYAYYDTPTKGRIYVLLEDFTFKVDGAI